MNMNIKTTGTVVIGTTVIGKSDGLALPMF